MEKAYIPPHKRHSSSPSPSPTPPPRFNRQNPQSKSAYNRKGKEKTFTGIEYAKGAISKWFPVGLLVAAAADDDDDGDSSQISAITHLEPLSLSNFQHTTESQKPPLILVLNCRALQEGGEETRKILINPWNFVAENVKQDLFSSFERAKREVAEDEIGEVKPYLVARIGKVLFYGGPSSSEEAIEGNSLDESALRKLRKSFYTNLPTSYVDYVINEVVRICGLCFESEKEMYQVKLADNKRPGSTISCKCVLGKDQKKLELHKVELNPLRHLVVDMSCPDKKLDVRLMLGTKRNMAALMGKEIELIKHLINNAVLDPEVKGGLRWPLGKDFSGDRYTVVGVWHTTAKSFRSSSIRLKVRQADRFSFGSSVGEDSGEVSLKMHGVVSLLHEPAFQSERVCSMLKDNLRLIWEYFLNGPAQ